MKLLLRPWFAMLVVSTAVDRLSCVSLGIIAERDFVVQVNAFKYWRILATSSARQTFMNLADFADAKNHFGCVIEASRDRQTDSSRAG